MTGPDHDCPREPYRSTDPLLDTFGPRHAQHEQPKYDVGAAFVAACEAIGVGNAPFAKRFCEELMRVICEENSIDAGQTAVVKAWKGRAAVE